MHDDSDDFPERPPASIIEALKRYDRDQKMTIEELQRDNRMLKLDVERLRDEVLAAAPTNTYRFQVISSGVVLGEYEGRTIHEAHDALARDAGYEGVSDMARRLGTTESNLRVDLSVRAL